MVISSLSTMMVSPEEYTDPSSTLTVVEELFRAPFSNVEGLTYTEVPLMVTVPAVIEELTSDNF
jgi:hypothetical protein